MQDDNWLEVRQLLSRLQGRVAVVGLDALELLLVRRPLAGLKVTLGRNDGEHGLVGLSRLGGRLLLEHLFTLDCCC